jgi:hypothetical protein
MVYYPARSEFSPAERPAGTASGTPPHPRATVPDGPDVGDQEVDGAAGLGEDAAQIILRHRLQDLVSLAREQVAQQAPQAFLLKL